MINSPEKIEKDIATLRTQAITLEQELVQYRRAKLAKEQEIQQLVSQESELKDTVLGLETRQIELNKELKTSEDELRETQDELVLVRQRSEASTEIYDNLCTKIKDTLGIWQ